MKKGLLINLLLSFFISLLAGIIFGSVYTEEEVSYHDETETITPYSWERSPYQKTVTKKTSEDVFNTPVFLMVLGCGFSVLGMGCVFLEKRKN